MAFTSRVFLASCIALLATPGLANTKKDRKITVKNQCTFTVWPALFTSVGPRPTQETGWEAAPGSTGCDFSDKSKPEYEQCETGGCIGGLKCDPAAGTGVLPVTLAEFNIQTDVDHYDTSNVDGYNVGLALTNSVGCPLSNCPYNLLASCPEELQDKNAKGEVVGCLTACGKWQTNEEYCCSGAHSTPDVCPSSGVKYYSWWKEACPIAYAYAYDESSGTALFTCTKQADWTITFCPDASLFETTALLPNGTTITQGKGFELFPQAGAAAKIRTSGIVTSTKASKSKTAASTPKATSTQASKKRRGHGKGKKHAGTRSGQKVSRR
ncbi:hypothetical protein JCM10450v2_002743 [Rhodotorula kratochvilovae]